MGGGFFMYEILSRPLLLPECPPAMARMAQQPNTARVTHRSRVATLVWSQRGIMIEMQALGLKPPVSPAVTLTHRRPVTQRRATGRCDVMSNQLADVPLPPTHPR